MGDGQRLHPAAQAIDVILRAAAVAQRVLHSDLITARMFFTRWFSSSLSRRWRVSALSRSSAISSLWRSTIFHQRRARRLGDLAGRPRSRG